jgi:hypothetical protein
MTLLKNALYWNYTCPDCRFHNRSYEEDHDFINCTGYTLRHTCEGCSVTHDIQIYCNPKKEMLVEVYPKGTIKWLLPYDEIHKD